MLQDGICQVTKTFFSKTIQFYDINYQLALNEDKTTTVSYTHLVQCVETQELRNVMKYRNPNESIEFNDNSISA